MAKNDSLTVRNPSPGRYGKTFFTGIVLSLLIIAYNRYRPAGAAWPLFELPALLAVFLFAAQIRPRLLSTRRLFVSCIAAAILVASTYPQVSDAFALLALFAACFILVKGLFSLFDSLAQKPVSSLPVEGKEGLKAALSVAFMTFITLCVIWLLDYFPSGTSADTQNQWAQAHGTIPLNDIHTPGHTMFLMALLSLCDSYAFVVLIHILMVSFLAGLFGRYLYANGIPFKWLFIPGIIFAGSAPVATYMYPWKDTPYTFAVGIVTYQLMRSRDVNGSHWLKGRVVAGVALAFCFLFRYNGIVCMLAVLCHYVISDAKRRAFKQMITLVSVLAVTVAGVNWLAYSVFRFDHRENGYALQAFGSGIAAVVANDGDISPEQLETVDRILGVEWIRKNYIPWNTKMLIWNQDEKGSKFLFTEGLAMHKTEIIRLYLQLFPKNLLICLRDVAYNTYSIWQFSGIFSHMFLMLVLLAAVACLWKRSVFRNRWMVFLPVLSNTASIAVSTITNEARYLLPAYTLFLPLLMYVVMIHSRLQDSHREQDGCAQSVSCSSDCCIPTNGNFMHKD